MDDHILRELLEDNLAIQYLSTLGGDYLPWSGYALRPSGLQQILNAILLRKCLTVVECGGGVSTLYIARLFRQRGWAGRLYCIENNLDWLRFLEQQLEQERLAAFMELIYAPLGPCDLAIANLEWYDTNAIRQQLPADLAIDCLFVDGPSAYLPAIQYARFPAVPFFQAQLSPGATVILDDINRPGEQEILRRWQELLNLTFNTSIGRVAISNPQ